MHGRGPSGAPPSRQGSGAPWGPLYLQSSSSSASGGPLLKGRGPTRFWSEAAYGWGSPLDGGPPGFLLHAGVRPGSGQGNLITGAPCFKGAPLA
ncbi:hypothetical protein Emed_003980 [Eimeria media]